jgi:hypothetical protein
MTKPLVTYLHDHLVGSKFAVQLLETIKDEHAEEPLGRFSAGLLTEVEEDRSALQGIADRVGKGPVDLKEVAGWLAEKASEFRLRRSSAGYLGTLEAMEALSLGIQGKLALWRVLKVVSDLDPRLGGVDYDALAQRAQDQHARVEVFRLEMARAAFAKEVK